VAHPFRQPSSSWRHFMEATMDYEDCRRRDFLALLGIGGVVFASGLNGCGGAGRAAAAPLPEHGPSKGAAQAGFFFLQLSDTHWGFKGPPNPQADTCLKQTVQAINAIDAQPDFIVFTGDLTQTTDDPAERRQRMAEFRAIVGGLKVQKLIFLPGEHDAAPDRGDAYREAFGEMYQAFEHKGVHFLALDNASAPGGAMGDAQLEWLAAQVGRVPAGAAHRLCPSTAVRSVPGVGMGHEGRRARHPRALAARKRHGLLRAHPPGEPPHDRKHRAPFGAVAGLPPSSTR